MSSLRCHWENSTRNLREFSSIGNASLKFENSRYDTVLDLLNITELSDAMMAAGVEWPGPKALGSMLDREGYEFLGKIRISPDSRCTFYSKHPAMFTSWNPVGGELTDPMKIKAYLRKRREVLEGDDL